jgi:hypothetical protein
MPARGAEQLRLKVDTKFQLVSVILVIGSFLTSSASAQVRHISQAETDRVLLCARHIFGKPVYTTVLGPWFDSSMKCSNREEVLQELEERQIALFENESAIMLVPPRIRPDIGVRSKIRWHKFEVNVLVSSFDKPLLAGSRILSKEEQRQVAKVILDEALLPPLVPGFAHVNGDTGEMDVTLALDAHHILPQTESVVALFGPPLGEMRLVYGELTQGTYRILWDTPLVGGADSSLSYKDVDGDGVPEIVFRWDEAGGNVLFDLISVFNIKGENLTREEECYPRARTELAQYACAIWGARVEFDKTASGHYDILVLPSWERDPGDVERYTLINGHYSLPIPILDAIEPKRLSLKNININGKIKLKGHNFIRGSEVSFTPISIAPLEQTYHRPGDPAEFVSSKELLIRVPDFSWIANAVGLASAVGEWKVRVQNPSGHSASLTLQVESGK